MFELVEGVLDWLFGCIVWCGWCVLLVLFIWLVGVGEGDLDFVVCVVVFKVLGGNLELLFIVVFI